MRFMPIAVLLSMSYPVWAADLEPTGSASVQTEDTRVRILGKLNANLATRDELLGLPMLDAGAVDRIIEARAHGRLTSLDQFQLSDDALARLTVSGPSTLHRIRPLPLETFTQARTAATH